MACSIPAKERFLNNIEIRNGSDCHWWTACKDPVGYGRFGKDCKTMLSHRAAWELFRGEIPKGLCVLHKCDNPSCVNPDHLWLGTNADNSRDKIIKGRHGSLSGDSHPKSKLTSADVSIILYLVGGGMKQYLVGNMFGICNTAVNHIVHGRTWKSISRPSRVTDGNYSPAPSEMRMAESNSLQ